MPATIRKQSPAGTGRRGFTIIELSAVIAIIGLLAAILLPTLARSREAGRRASCMMNLSQIGMAMRIYADESNGQLPWSGGNGDAHCLYTLRTDTSLDYGLFVCPSDSNYSSEDFSEYEMEESLKLDVNPNELRAFGLRASYDYFGAYTTEPIQLPPPTRAPGRVPVMWDIGAEAYFDLNHSPGNSNVLWLDGSVTLMRHEDFHGTNLPYAPPGIDYLDPVSVEAILNDGTGIR